MNFEDQVAKICYEKYNSFKNSGKPRPNEWTVLSGIVLQNSKDQLVVVSLCTGTKCLSGSELLDTSLWPRGSRVSDSHAEILARRAFQRYLYYQLELVQKSMDSEVFKKTQEGKIELKENLRFHFFSSQSPCGDCSIIPKFAKEDEPLNKIAKLDSEDEFSQVEDIHRTGAKCLSEELQDSRESGSRYHTLGPLRTKPGRGDRTLSLSCSDKMAKWIITGLQGSLLSILIPTVKIDSIIIGGSCPFSQKSMQRGLFKRFGHEFQPPKIFQSSAPFSCLRDKTRTQPCPSSIVWCNVPNRDTEVAVECRKQGATKKMKRANYLLISRLGLFELFYKAIETEDRFKTTSHPKKITYRHCKLASKEYRQTWTDVRLKYFNTWPRGKEHLQDFIL